MNEGLAGLLGAGVTMAGLDGLFLGVVARDFYKNALGPLMRPSPNLAPAVTFYLLYVLFLWLVAVRPCEDWLQAAGRGACVGALAYGTYELTNWSVIAGWPAKLVPVDWAWGTFLTALSAAVGVFLKLCF